MNPAEKAKFEAEASVRLAPSALAALARRARDPAARTARLRLAAALAHAAFAAPERVAASYDAVACAWLGGAIAGAPIRTRRRRALPIPAALWPALWAIRGDAEAGRLDAGLVTARVAGLGALLDPRFRTRAAEAALAWPGNAAVADKAMPPRWTLDRLARRPAGSLARDFHRLIVETGFDLEVLERDDAVLAAMPRPLGYLNARILQCHDLWHIVAGYQTTPMDEVAISAFQLGQFGHPYSAMFLAFVAAGAADRDGPAFPLLMDTIFTAWKHGRETAPLMGHRLGGRLGRADGADPPAVRDRTVCPPSPEWGGWTAKRDGWGDGLTPTVSALARRATSPIQGEEGGVAARCAAVASMASTRPRRWRVTPSGRPEKRRLGAAASSMTKTPRSSARRMRRPKAWAMRPRATESS
jgi:ubiquinone biosynthesis protein Coq4